MRESLAELVRGRGLILGLAAAVMVALPVALTLARDVSYESRIPLVVAPASETGQRVSQAEVRRYAETLIPTERVARASAFQASFPLDPDTVVENTRVEGRPRGGVNLVIESDTPMHAQELAELEGKLIEDLSKRRRDRGSDESRRLPDLFKRESNPDLPAAERREARVAIAEVLSRLDRKSPLLERATTTAPEPEVTGSVDKLVERLPGEFPANPGPLAAGVAGLLLALSLFAAWALVGPMRDAASRRGG